MHASMPLQCSAYTMQIGQALPHPPVNLHAMGTGSAKGKLVMLENLVQWFLLVEVLDGFGGQAITLQANNEGKLILSPGLAASISDEFTKHRSFFPLQWSMRALWHAAVHNPLHPSTAMSLKLEQLIIHLRKQFISFHGEVPACLLPCKRWRPLHCTTMERLLR